MWGKCLRPAIQTDSSIFCVPFREDEFIDDEEDHHRHAAGEDSGEDIVQEIGDAQRARTPTQMLLMELTTRMTPTQPAK